MNQTIFTLPRRGLLGSTPVGADYMEGVNARARRLAKACRVEPTADAHPKSDRQLPLPFKLDRK